MKRTLTTEEYTAVEEKVLEIIRQLVMDLGVDRAIRAVTLDASLDRDLGLGSLERVELLVRVEKAFSIQIPDHLVAEAETPRDLAHAILHSVPGKETLRQLPRGHRPITEEATRVLATLSKSACTLQEVLRAYAQAEPDRPHIYLQSDESAALSASGGGSGGEEQIITYGELYESAAAVAAGLLGRDHRQGETVAIMLPTGHEFFSAFFGILLASGVPVPIYPPYRPDRIEEYAWRQAAILKNAGIRFLITFSKAEALARLLRPFVPTLAEVTTLDKLMASHTRQQTQTFSVDDAALIQYTSGSTSEPKGVLLTHQSILANIRAVGEAVQIRPNDVGVSWLPLYHDMGLIGSWLCSLYFGIPITILSPFAFLNRPERWLWAIHYHRATLSPAPNFAYELCIRKIEEKSIQGLDLSSWRIAFNGAEAVSPDTLTRFIQRFAPYGFRPEAMFPVYGLAESAVALTFPPLERRPRVDLIVRESFQRYHRAEPASPSDSSPLRFVSCGIPLPGHEVRIVDDQDHELGERIEGSLQFRGPSSMKGYFRSPEVTQAAFHDGWWDSGDLAYKADGEVFITGRRKDVIIKAGRNLYPQEVEEVAGEIPGIRKGCVTAFGITDPTVGTERLVVVAETKETNSDARGKLNSAIIERVTTTVGVPPDQVLLVPPGTTPKTSSGKLRRSACRQAYLNGELVHHRPPGWLQITKLFAVGLLPRIERGFSALGRLLYAAYAWTIVVITVPPAWLAVATLPGGKTAAKVFRLWARGLLWLVGCPLRVEGQQHLRRLGPMILVANHSSYLDVVALTAALPTDYLFVAKQELLHAPIIRTFIKKIGHLTVDRMDFSKSVSDTNRIEDTLRAGGSVLIFPEGTFTRATGLRPFKLGAFKVAVDTSRPICPIAICGTRQILWPDSWSPRHGPITVVIGAPIYPQGSDWREITRLRDAARAEIARHCGEQPLDLVSAGPSQA
jgi:acyl carrier protein